MRNPVSIGVVVSTVVVDNSESRRVHFPSREILQAFGRDDESIQLERSPNAGPKDGLGW